MHVRPATQLPFRPNRVDGLVHEPLLLRGRPIAGQGLDLVRRR
jgi:hypothetical protein